MEKRAVGLREKRVEVTITKTQESDSNQRQVVVLGFLGGESLR